jgi:cysteine synthase A
VIDLRQSTDYDIWHLPGSQNKPLTSLGPHTPSPFSDAGVLEAQWIELEKIFQDVSDLRHVLVVCYNGDSARVATSVLRAKGLEADSVLGGYGALKNFIGEKVIGKSIGTTVSVQAVPLD